MTKAYQVGCKETHSNIKGAAEITDKHWLLSLRDDNLSYS